MPWALMPSMKLPEQLNWLLRVPRLTGPRTVLALLVAGGADGLQLILAEFGWLGLDQVIDGVAMVLLTWLLGFHVLFLPTFVVELIPVVEDLPTWTACTAAVIVLRKREQRPPPPAPTDPPAIDI